MNGREQPDRPVRTLSSVKGTQKSQPSVDHRTSLTPSSDTSHLRLVSLTTPGLPQGTSPQPAQHPGFVSPKHQESFFSPPDYYFFFYTSWTFCCQKQCLGPWFSSSWGRTFEAPPTYPPDTPKPPPTRVSTFFTCVYFLICSVNIAECLWGKGVLSQQRSQTFVWIKLIHNHASVSTSSSHASKNCILKLHSV